MKATFVPSKFKHPPLNKVYVAIYLPTDLREVLQGDGETSSTSLVRASPLSDKDLAARSDVGEYYAGTLEIEL